MDRLGEVGDGFHSHTAFGITDTTGSGSEPRQPLITDLGFVVAAGHPFNVRSGGRLGTTRGVYRIAASYE